MCKWLLVEVMENVKEENVKCKSGSRRQGREDRLVADISARCFVFQSAPVFVLDLFECVANNESLVFDQALISDRLEVRSRRVLWW
jgi:hypothetical protein